MRFLEDIVIGEVEELGRHTFTADEIRRFSTAFDPQPFHVDEALAAASHFGRLTASGWHTGAVFMQLWTAYCRRYTDEMTARGERVAKLGPSPGFRDLKWLRPVQADDVVSYRLEWTSARVSVSRPGWGLAKMTVTASNQTGELVFSFDGAVFVERRPA
ncbi:MaoC/PaaZ C-terminal domain-containing protein [Blastochloris viridis]|uniref:MaoC/PaaZ C-terminal domain-containing protein n=1 Tax=Blastochloris viridis TaxID=1079 RepID=UPI0006D74994|nr:MaoC/PaaZ C-terminal domain-containing protein [Blastochloris viridis]ALK10247.1 MaoC like domain protein [Blastochloris viridis]